jgi:hypothetical protein
MLRKLCGFAATASLCVSVMLFGLSLRENRRPSAALLTTPEPINLGVVDQGKKVPFVFEIKNPSTATFEVTGLNVSCGCTWLNEVKGTSIAPAESLSIRGTLDSKGRRGPMNSLAVLKYRASPEGPPLELRLQIEANVKPTLLLEPESIVVDLVAGSAEKIVRFVTLNSEIVDLFTIFDPESSVPWITAEVIDRQSRKGLPGASPARLKITIDPAGPAPEQWITPSTEQFVRVRTSAETEPNLMIPVLIRKPR